MAGTSPAMTVEGALTPPSRHRHYPSGIATAQPTSSPPTRNAARLAFRSGVDDDIDVVEARRDAGLELRELDAVVGERAVLVGDVRVGVGQVAQGQRRKFALLQIDRVF